MSLFLPFRWGHGPATDAVCGSNRPSDCARPGGQVRNGLSGGGSRIRTIGSAKRPSPPWPLNLLPPCISVSFIPPERCRGPQENSGRIGGFEKGEFERDSARKEVAAQICVRRADKVQLPAQEIDEPTKIRSVVQRDPLGVYQVVR